MEKQVPGKAIIYDDNCPLCTAYTAAFVKGGLLKKENRISFSNVNMQQFKIDWNRAKHEIPVIDLDSGQVKYGVDALTEILQQKFPFILKLIRVKCLSWFFRKLYKLISYNRKIIVASNNKNKPAFDCTPDYSFPWRWILIITCYSIANLFITTSAWLIFRSYAIHLSPLIVINWMLIPVLLSFFASWKLATEIHAHVAITAVVTGFLLLTASCCLLFFQNIFLLFYAMLLLILLVTLKQLVRRANFIYNMMHR